MLEKMWCNDENPECYCVFIAKRDGNKTCKYASQLMYVCDYE